MHSTIHYNTVLLGMGGHKVLKYTTENTSQDHSLLLSSLLSSAPTGGGSRGHIEPAPCSELSKRSGYDIVGNRRYDMVRLCLGRNLNAGSGRSRNRTIIYSGRSLVVTARTNYTAFLYFITFLELTMGADTHKDRFRIFWKEKKNVTCTSWVLVGVSFQNIVQSRNVLIFCRILPF